MTYCSTMSYKNPNHPFIVWAACVLWSISVFAILWSLLLFFCIGDMLFLTGTDMVNALVLLSGIIMLPTNLYIVYAISYGKSIDNNAKVMCCRLWTSIIWIIIINVIGVILCVQRMYSCQSITTQYISNSMKQYRTVPKHKHFIDNLQWSLGCCGLHSYKDWFTRDWHDKVRDYEWNPVYIRETKPLKDLIETDSVPLSCCRSGSCVSSYLKELGTYSINTNGCGFLLYRIIMISLCVHLFMFITVIILEGLLLKFTSNKKKTSTGSRKGSKRLNLRSIMSVKNNFDISSGSCGFNAEDSDEINAVEHYNYRDGNDEN